MRLVDLHCDWLRQYAAEVTDVEGPPDPDLSGASAGSTATCSAPRWRSWPARPRPRTGTTTIPGARSASLARYESEFTGRLIRDAADTARWRSSPTDGLCWGVLGVGGFDSLVRTADDLDRLPGLFGRGVRVFQPIRAAGGVLGGANEPGDDRGLTELGRAFLDRIAALAPSGEAGPRPILDLAGMSTMAMADTLRWYDEGPAGRERPLLVVSHGTVGYRDLGDPSSPSSRHLAELRARGVILGLTPGLPGCETVDELKAVVDAIAAIPFEGRPGAEGLAIGADLLGIDRPIPGLDSARSLVRWLEKTFDRETAAAIVARNARRLLLPRPHRWNDKRAEQAPARTRFGAGLRPRRRP